MTATASKFDEMNKEELRAACREAGVPYGKLNNYGMRAALVMHYAKTDAVEEQVEAEVEAEVEACVQQPVFRSDAWCRSDAHVAHG